VGLSLHLIASFHFDCTLFFTQESTMRTNDLLAEIRDANLSYLMLAQQMIRDDKPAAIFRLGLSQPIADMLDALSNAQVLKLAGSASMLTRFRFDDATVLGMLTHDSKERTLAQSHAAVLLASQPFHEMH
jgi:flagellar transcriptional activator FlhD